MTQPLPLIILRPEPGATETGVRANAAGLTAGKVPLFAAGAIDWTAPNPHAFDALLITSANAPRFAGPGLASLASLPVWCVGAASAAAAKAAGLDVRHIGQHGAQAALDAASSVGVRHMLWLAGQERTAVTPPAGLTLLAVPVYHARPLPVSRDQLAGPAVALVHSKRAARRLASLAPDRSQLHLVAISPAVTDAAGTGWASVTTAAQPDDGEMVAIAAQLCHDVSQSQRTE